MRLSQLFGQTLREPPAESEVASHQLLLRAGFIRQLAAGIFNYLPLARRAMNKIEGIIRKEIEGIGGQEMTLPAVHPVEIWEKTGRRLLLPDAAMGRFKDRNAREMALASTHEEVVADLVGKEIRSYRQLPVLIYHTSPQWSDDSRPRVGLMQARETLKLNSYSLDRNAHGLDQQYQHHYQAYFRIFQQLGLPMTAVKSDAGLRGGKEAHEFIYLTPRGADILMSCDECGYSASRQFASFQKKLPAAEDVRPLEKVATPECKTIAELADFLGVEKSQTAKAVFLVAALLENEKIVEKFLFAVVRGDMEVNEAKLANLVRALSLRPATEDEILAAGAVPGYASPVGLEGAFVVVDDAVVVSPNLVAGANEEGYHLLNVNYGRDFTGVLVGDIVLSQADDGCPKCGAPLRLERGVEVGNIFKLDGSFCETMGCFYLDENGKAKPVEMGAYGISVEKLLACIAEAHHDEHGLIWPPAVAPFQVHLILLKGKGAPEAEDLAQKLYMDLSEAGFEVLFDDRAESPGVKFNDADLIGVPLRLTVSERALKAGGVEFKRRDLEQKDVLPLNGLSESLWRELDQCQHRFEEKLK